MKKRFLEALIAAAILGCGGGDSTQTEASASCADRPTIREKDVCYLDRLKATPPSDTESASQAVQSISDPMIKSAGVLEWVAKHNREIEVQAGVALCGLLSNWEKTQCERRLYAAHLQR